MTAIETVWERLKMSARDYATQGVRPSSRHAEAMVSQFIRQADVDPIPPPEIVELYAREMLQMIDDFMDKSRR